MLLNPIYVSLLKILTHLKLKHLNNGWVALNNLASETPCFSIQKDSLMRNNEVGETMRNMYSVYFKTACLYCEDLKTNLRF